MKTNLILWLVILPIVLFGQNSNPSQNKIYRFNEVMRIDLLMSNYNKETLLDDVDIESNEYLPANVMIRNSEVDTLIYGVGVRLRGNTSRNKVKKSIKISFTAYEGEKFYNNKKFNLKAEVNDPSLLREYLSLHMYRNYGIPAARASFVELYINNEYMGVYLNVEQIDDEFVDRRFTDNEEGNLFRCYWGASLSDLNDVYNDNIYELKINKDRNDRDGLNALIQSVINANPNNTDSLIGSCLNLDGYIKQLAVESFLGHWDGYTRNKNNFYLYEDTTSKKMQFIPYDLDNTWGIDWGFVDYENEIPNDWHANMAPLSEKVLASPDLYDQYAAHLVTLAENLFNETYLLPVFDSLQKLLSPYVKTDKYYTYDNGYTYTDFQTALNTAWGNHVWYSLREYLSLRRSQYLNNLNTYESLGSIGVIDPFEALIFNQFSNPPLAIAKPKSNGDAIIYPNPIKNNRFYIDAEKPLDTKQISIYDCLGRKLPVNVQMTSNTKYLITFRQLPTSGVYQLKMNSQAITIIIE